MAEARVEKKWWYKVAHKKQTHMQDGQTTKIQNLQTNSNLQNIPKLLGQLEIHIHTYLFI